MNAAVKSGRFIALEGGEGTGKSTQARLLADALAARGIEVEVTREPGGTIGAEAIRELLLSPPGHNCGEEWGAEAEALLFAAARADHVAKRIRPALEQGRWVICDRFLDSSRAYQGGAGGFGDEAVRTLHAIGSGGLRPDLTLLIDVAPESVAARLADRDGGVSDAIGGRDASYHASVASTFLDMARSDPEGFRIVDGNASPDEVHERILAAMTSLLQGAS